MDEATRLFLERSFGFHDPRDWMIMDETGPDSQQASAMDLVLFPETAFQWKLEPCLLQNEFGPTDESEIIFWLKSQHLETWIRFSERNFPTRFPSSLIPGFVRRLHITYRIAPELVAPIFHALPKPLGWEVCVMIRNHDISWNTWYLEDMVRFLESFRREPDGWIPCLSDLLACIREGEIGEDLVTGLARKRDLWVERFHAAARVSRMMAGTNAETMMLAGNRILSMTSEEAVRRIEALERILFRMGSRDK